MNKILKNKKAILLAMLCLKLLVLPIAYIANYFSLVNKISMIGARNNLVDKELACDLSEKNQITHNYIFKFVADEQKLNIANAYTSYPELVPHAIEIVKTIAKTKNNEFAICNIYSYNYDNLEEAKICYSKLIKENPTNVDYYLARAKVQSNSENAIEDNEKGLKLLIADKTYPNKDEKLESTYCDLFNDKLIKRNTQEENIIKDGEMCISNRMRNRQVDKYSSVNARTYKELGNLYKEMGDLNKAQEMHYNAIISEPFNKEYQRAMLYTFPFGNSEGSAYLYNAVCLEEESYLACDKSAKYNQAIGTDLSFVGYTIMGNIDLEMKNYKSALINFEKAKNYNNIHNQETIDLINKKIELTRNQSAKNSNKAM